MLVDEDVAGLEVAVDDVTLVEVGEALQDLPCDPPREILLDALTPARLGARREIRRAGKADRVEKQIGLRSR
eukprot:1013986-Rhodomonas_salina.1